MKALALALALAAVLLAAACVPPTPGEPTSAPTIAFVGVHVVPMDGDRILSDHTVLVRGDRIAAVGPATQLEVPAGAVTVAGRGRYLLPGLAEMHGHIPPPTAPPEEIEETLFLFLARGVTTVRGMLGHAGQLELRRQAATGETLSPTLYLAGPSFSGASIGSADEAAARVRQQRREGWDLLKVHPGLELAEYEALAETARVEGMRFAGHVPAAVGIHQALALGQETIDHLDGYVEALDGARAPVEPQALEELVRATREAGAGVVPTMALWEVLLGAAELEELLAYPELAYVSRERVEQWQRAFEARLAQPGYDRGAALQLAENRIRVLAALHRGGVPVLFGTDAPQQFSVPGFSVAREIPFMSQAGMSNLAILQSATREVGRHFQDLDRFGLVAPGHRADLVLLDANPLTDLAALEEPAGVMVRGRWLPREELTGRLAEIAARHRH